MEQTPREYCKTRAEEDYSTTPISVLAYISRLEIESEEYKAKEIKGDRLLVEYSHQIAVLKAELKAANQKSADKRLHKDIVDMLKYGQSEAYIEAKLYGKYKYKFSMKDINNMIDKAKEHLSKSEGNF